MGELYMTDKKRQALLHVSTLDKLEEVAPEWCETHAARAAWAAKVAEESSRSD